MTLAPALQLIEDEVRHEVPRNLHPSWFVPHVLELYVDVARAVEHMGQPAVTAAVVHVFESYYHRLEGIRDGRRANQSPS